jgi:hypothetical protein
VPEWVAAVGAEEQELPCHARFGGVVSATNEKDWATVKDELGAG